MLARKKCPKGVVKMVLMAVLIVNCCVSSGQAQKVTQNKYPASWFTVLSTVKFAPKWSVMGELHERTGKFFSDQGQFLFRPSIEFHLHPNMILSAGPTYINVQPFAPINQPLAVNEYNIWEQVLLTFDVGKAHFQNRIRFEQRWIDDVVVRRGEYVKEGFVYKNRFRFRFNATHDIISIKEHTLFAHLFDEIWIEQDNNWLPVGLGRNWFYLGTGIKLKSGLQLEVGYLNQLDARNGGYLKSEIMQVTVVKNFDWSGRKKGKEEGK